MTLPNELHVEILRQVDIPSLCWIRSMNRYFRELVDSNEKMLVREILKNVECVGPHAYILEEFLPYGFDYSLSQTARIYYMKRTVVYIAEICQFHSDAKIEAVYCLEHLIGDCQEWMLDPERDEFEGTGEPFLDDFRGQDLGQFTAEQLQHMLPVVIRLVFKLAQLMEEDRFEDSMMSDSVYSHYNNLLVVNGLDAVVELSKLPDLESRREYVSSALEGVSEQTSVIHEEIIDELCKEAFHLLSNPATELRDWFREQDTYLYIPEIQEVLCEEEEDDDDENDFFNGFGYGYFYQDYSEDEFEDYFQYEFLDTEDFEEDEEDGDGDDDGF